MNMASAHKKSIRLLVDAFFMQMSKIIRLQTACGSH
jgi:hypothetical protein